MALDYGYNEKPDIETTWGLVISINNYIHEFTTSFHRWENLKRRCTASRLVVQKQGFFEFSDQSILSNLYWGVDNIESAIQSKWCEERTSKLRNSERMLQAPALLDEVEITGGVPNRFLVCCSYFYLAVVRNLLGDDLQVALHFLQAVLVFPRLVAEEFAPELCVKLFPSLKFQEMGRRKTGSFRFREDDFDESMRRLARRYKHWLMYYQVLQSGNQTVSTHDVESQRFKNEVYSDTELSFKSIDQGNSSRLNSNYSKVHPFDPQEYELVSCDTFQEIQDHREVQKRDQLLIRNSSIKRLQDMLEESQSDNLTFDSGSIGYSVGSDFEESLEVYESSTKERRNLFDQQLCACRTPSGSECTEIILLKPHQDAKQMKSEMATAFSKRLNSSIHDLDLSDMMLSDERSNSLCHVKDRTIASPSSHGYNLHRFKNNSEDSLCWEEGSKTELLDIIEMAISRLCFAEGLMKCDNDYAVEVRTIYEMLNSKAGVKYSMLKDVIVEQLVKAISSSEEDRVVSASVSTLLGIVSVNESVLDNVKNGLQLNDLGRALKRNVQEVAMLIYLIKPAPAEMKSLGLFPQLVKVVCNSKGSKSKPESLQLTPQAASLMLIEVLVTAFDSATNNMHLAAINSPVTLTGLSDAARHQNLKELMSLATILVKCMQFDGQCRESVLQSAPVAPLVRLLCSKEKHATIKALEVFNEMLRIPRSSAIGLLQQIREEGGIEVLHTFMNCFQELEPDYQILAANLLFQLDTLESSSGKSAFREKPLQVLLKAAESEDNSSLQLLSSSILANIGGTFSWTGEPYTVAWLVKRAGLSSFCLQNLIKDFDWLDHSLQDDKVEVWCSNIARTFISHGMPVFRVLGKGLKSKIKRVSQDCLIIIAWLGIEIAKSPSKLKHSACEILLDGVEQFLHPGMDIEERLLACLCIYNYASGKGMQKVVHFSEGVRESLRRFSNVTWMAEELHRVADYYLPNKSRISCVHTQIWELRHKCSGAVTALIYYKGLLFSGYSDGSIKVWDMESQSAKLIWDIKEHRKAVTCFSLFEPGNTLLSGSADKTVKVWQMVHRKLELIEVIAMKEPVRRLDSCGQMIFVITQDRRLKALDSSRAAKDICRNKNVKCMSVVQGRIYVGCTDSSIQELAIANYQEREIKAPAAKAWRIQTKPINSIVVYKDCLYNAGSTLEGSNIKEWRKQSAPQMSLVPEKGTSIVAMGVVEDFIYLNCNSSSSCLQIWLRETQQKVGRISAGSKITSLLTANDVVLCGTESGLIKGWIPL